MRNVCFQEERIATLEQRYLNAQRESTVLRDNSEKLEEELRSERAQLQLEKECVLTLQEKLELSQQKLTEYSKLPDVEEELRRRMAALTQVGERTDGSVHLPDGLFIYFWHNISSSFVLKQFRQVSELDLTCFYEVLLLHTDVIFSLMPFYCRLL